MKSIEILLVKGHLGLRAYPVVSYAIFEVKGHIGIITVY